MLNPKISILKVIFLIIVMIGSTSCFDAGKKETNAKAAFAVTSFIGGSWTGGAVIWAKGPSGQFKALTLNYGDAETVVNLESGSWQFMAAGWLGSSPAAGAIKCGKLGLVLKDGDNSVPISLSQAGCTDSIFSPAAFQTAGTLKPIRLISCSSIGTPTPGSNCNGGASKGKIRSYRIVLSQMNGGAPVPDFKTDCIDDPGGVASVSNTSIKIPLGYVGSTPLHTTIVGYSNPGCGTFEKAFIFKDGLINPSNNADTKVLAEANFTEVYLEAPTIPIFSNYSAAPGNYVNGGAITTNTPTISGTGPFTFTVSPGLPTGLSLNSSTGLITGTPSLASASSIYNVTANGPGGSDTFALTIEVLEPALLTMNNMGYDFSTQAIGSTTTQIFTISNGPGRALATFGSTVDASPFLFNGAFPGAGGTCASTLIGGASCDIEIFYTPGGSGGHAAIIGVNYNDGIGTTSIGNSISGTGAAPAVLTISGPATINMGTYTVGDSGWTGLTLTNTGGFVATGIAESGLGANYNITFAGTTPCTTTLAAGSSCDMRLYFTPTSSGVLADTMSMDYNDGASATSVTKGTTGTAFTPALLTIDGGGTFNFGNSLTATNFDHTFTVSNSGESPASSISDSLPAGQYSLKGGSYPGTGGNCGITLAASGSCTVVVTFSPASINTFPDTITLNYFDGAAGQAATQNITGAGVNPPVIVIDDAVGSESTGGNATFTVSSPIAINQQMDFDYSPSAGTAALATDFNLIAGSGFIPPGSKTATIVVAVSSFDDASIEVDESFSVTISNPVNAVIGDSTGVGVVISDDSTKIYRSVGIGSTTSLEDGAANAMIIKGGIATFTSGVSVNIGIGDMLEFDSDNNGTIDYIAMISKRLTPTNFVVRATDGKTAPPNMIIPDNDWKLFRAYTSLANAETGTENTGIDSLVRDFDTWTGGKDIASSSEQWNIVVYADAIETGAISIGGWVTSTDNYLKVFTPQLVSEVGVSQRHNGTAGTGFRIMRNTNIPFVISGVAHVRVSGLEVVFNNPLDFHAAMQFSSDAGAGDTTAEVWFTENIVSMTGTLTGTGANNGIQINGGLQATTVVKISNNVIYDTFKNGIHLLSANHYVYNNTVSGAGNVGIAVSANSVVINNISNNSTVTDYSGTPSGTSKNNASSPGGGPPVGASGRSGQTFSFTNSAAGDFTLSGGDTGAKDFGFDLSSDPNHPITKDVTGILRSGAFDMGADGI